MTATKESPKRQKFFTIIVAVILTAILLFYMFTFQVRFTDYTIVTSFGKPTRTVKEPGLYWKLPYPFQSVYTFDARLQVLSGKLEQVLTADDKNVIVSTYVGWRIDDPTIFLTRVGNIENAGKVLEGLVRSYTNGVISQHPFSHLIADSKEISRWAEIEKQILTRLNEGEGERKDGKEGSEYNQGVRQGHGLVVEIFGIQRLELPEKTTQEVFNRMREERNRLAEGYRSQGEGKAQEIKAEAESEKKALMIKAMAEAKEIVGKGDAEAAKHYQVFEKNRELALWLFKLDSLEKLLGKKTTIILDTHTSPFDLLHSQETVKKEPIQEKPAEVKTSDSQTKTGTPDKSMPEKPVTDKPANGETKPVTDKPANGETKPVTDKPVNGQTKPVTDKPANGQTPENQNRPETPKSPESPKPDESAPKSPETPKEKEQPATEPNKDSSKTQEPSSQPQEK